MNLIGQFLNAATSYFGGLTPGKKEHRGLQQHQEEIMKGKKKVQFLERIIVFFSEAETHSTSSTINIYFFAATCFGATFGWS